VRKQDAPVTTSRSDDRVLLLVLSGRLLRVLRFTIERGKIAQVDVVADRARLPELDLAVP
jgi:hypothetical protein